MNTELVNVITDSSIPGRLHMTWDGAANVTIPNGDIIFRLRFRGIQSGLSAIEWNDFLPGICGVYDETGTAIQFNYTAGAANYLQAPDAVITGDTEVCFGEPITLTALGDTLTHVWTLPDGSLFTGQVYQVLNSALADSGSYRLLTTNTIGCIDKDTVQVNVHEMPQVSLASADSLCAEATYTLSPGAFATYLWQDGSTNPTFTASGEGLFWVQVTDNAGCTGSDSVSLIICPAALLVPNAFSPNYDGHNDRFRARYTDLDGLEDFKMLIYNRWGQLIFESNSIQQGWDGNYTNGEQCPAGLYTYVILFKKPEGKTLSQKSPYRGMVTLVR
jgi:gliding motility-associated-like protein